MCILHQDGGVRLREHLPLQPPRAIPAATDPAVTADAAVTAAPNTVESTVTTVATAVVPAISAVPTEPAGNVPESGDVQHCPAIDDVPRAHVEGCHAHLATVRTWVIECLLAPVYRAAAPRLLPGPGAAVSNLPVNVIHAHAAIAR